MSDLIKAIRINEEIKHVLDDSRQINLVALNALLTARQAGERSRGFSVVARQLRALSGELEQAMSALDAVIASLVGNIAEALKEERLNSYIAGAHAATETPPPCLERMRVAARGRVARRQEAAERCWARLDTDVRRTLRLSEMGGALSRNAKVEAAHGGAMAAMLTQVAGQIEQTVENITRRLRALRATVTR